MTLKELHRLAVELRGDPASRALGHADNRLSRNPGDRLALMYKGSLLTLVGDDVLPAEKRRDYVRAGIALMESAATTIGHYPTAEAELACIRWTTLAMLPPQHGQDRAALAGLRALVRRADFDLQERFERVRALTLLSCLAQAEGAADEAGKAFVIARGLDEALAIRTFTAWTERSGPIRS